MIKTSEIKQEIKEVEKELANESGGKPSIINRLKKRLQFLATCKNYIESKPTEEFVKKEVTRLENKINLLTAGFIKPENIDNKTLAKIKSEYDSEMGIKKLRNQLRTLRYLAK